jgi:hydroxyethylthiazole kinase
VKTTSIIVDHEEVAKELAKSKSSTVVMTGKEDIISDGKIYIIRDGNKQMGVIVGAGYMAATVICVFASINSNYCDASKDVLCYFGVAGEFAAEESNGLEVLALICMTKVSIFQMRK